MTASPESLDRKVRQLDKDVQSIYDMLAAIQGTLTRHGNRVEGLDSRVGGVAGDVTSILELLRSRG